MEASDSSGEALAGGCREFLRSASPRWRSTTPVPALPSAPGRPVPVGGGDPGQLAGDVSRFVLLEVPSQGGGDRACAVRGRLTLLADARGACRAPRWSCPAIWSASAASAAAWRRSGWVVQQVVPGQFGLVDQAGELVAVAGWRGLLTVSMTWTPKMLLSSPVRSPPVAVSSRSNLPCGSRTAVAKLSKVSWSSATILALTALLLSVCSPVLQVLQQVGGRAWCWRGRRGGRASAARHARR